MITIKPLGQRKSEHKFCIFIRGGLGDTIKHYFGEGKHGDGWEYLVPLKEKYPDAIIKLITFTANTQSAHFYKYHPLIDEIYQDKWKHPLEPCPIVNDLKGQDYKLIKDFQKNALNVDVVDELKPVRQSELYLSPEDQDFVNHISWAGPYVVLHPFAGDPSRLMMPIEEYIPLTQHIINRGLNVVVVGANWKKPITDCPARKVVEKFQYHQPGVINLIDRANARVVSGLIMNSVCLISVRSYCFALTKSGRINSILLISHPKSKTRSYYTAKDTRANLMSPRFGWDREIVDTKIRLVGADHNYDLARREILNHLDDFIDRPKTITELTSEPILEVKRELPQVQMKLKPKPDHSKSWKETINKANGWLQSQSGPKYIFEQNRNLGDTLHLVPIIKHYRLLQPNAKIVFITARSYVNAHQHNPDIDKIFTCDKLEPKDRIALRKKLLTLKDITIVAPSIFPYGSVWKELSWSYANIADQYLFNSGIKDLKPQGGRRLRVYLTDNDRKWAANFIQKHDLEGKTLCSLEFNSYSHTPAWRVKPFAKFVKRMAEYKVKCISFAGPTERAIPGSIDATGVNWRQTVALMEHIHVHVGVGSGLTMLAAAAENQPKICEILIPESITMKGCGYADSIRIVNKDPTIVADHIWFKVLH